LLLIKDLCVRYGSVEALRSICAEVEQGSFVSFIGPNGAGKTTLMQTISGLNKPFSGEIRLLGKRIDGLAPKHIVRAGIAQVPEERRIFPYMTVLENLNMGAFLRSDRKAVHQDLTRMFELFPILEQRSNQAGGTLSGGEQQMLAIARALMAMPRLLLLDEPSLGLAPLVIGELAKMIRGINQSGITVVLVEQNIHMAFKLAQRCYVLETGQVVLEGRTEELVHNPEIRQAYLGG